MSYTIYSSMTGKIVQLEAVPDPTFSQKMLGEGVAIIPTMGKCVAPVDGRITVLHKSGHAVALQMRAGIMVLVHVGLGTVHLDGKGFTIPVKLGQRVRRGDTLVEFDLAIINDSGYQTISPIVLPDLDPKWAVKVHSYTEAVAGQTPLLEVDKK